jgi:hypothetical protein
MTSNKLNMARVADLHTVLESGVDATIAAAAVVLA